MDSHQKYVASYFDKRAVAEKAFHRVNAVDLDEIQVLFITKVTELDFADNFRIYPLSQKALYQQQKETGCCGYWDVQHKCKSGNIYLLGCNYGH